MYLDAVEGSRLLGANGESVSDPRRSPLHDMHVSSGAIEIEFAGCVWVDRYRHGVAHEYDATTSKAGLIDVSLMSHVEFSGGHALSAAQQYFTNNIVDAPDASIRYGAIVDPAGMVIDDVLIYRLSETRVWMMLNIELSEVPEAVQTGWRQAEFSDLTGGFALMQLQGPRAHQCLLNALAAAGSAITAPVDLPSYFRAGQFDFDGRQVIVGGCGFTGVGGYEIIADPTTATELWELMVAGGAEPFGISTIEYLRVEAGMICNGHEYNVGTHQPHELGLARFDKRKTSPKADTPTPPSGSEQRLVWAVFEAGIIDLSAIPGNGDPIDTTEHGRIGHLTSTVFSPLHDRFIALAMVDAPVVAATGQTPISAQVVTEPDSPTPGIAKIELVEFAGPLPSGEPARKRPGATEPAGIRAATSVESNGQEPQEPIGVETR